MDWIYYASILLAGYSLVWAISKFVLKRRHTSKVKALNNDANEAGPGIIEVAPKSMRLQIFLNIIGVFGLAVAGCYAGFWLGWGIGRMLGYTGGNSIGTVMMAIIATPAGAALGIVLGIVVIRTTRLHIK